MISQTFLVLCYRWEFKMNYEEWVTVEKPNLGDITASRVNESLTTTSHLMTLALHVKEETRHAINELLKVALETTTEFSHGS